MGESKPRSQTPRWKQVLTVNSRIPWKVRLGILGFIVPVVVLAFLPTRLGAASAEHPALDDASRRKPRPKETCALTEARTERGCVSLAATELAEEEATVPSSIPDKGLDALTCTVTVPRGGPAGVKRAAVVVTGGSGPHSRDGECPGDLLTKHDPPLLVMKEVAEIVGHAGLIAIRCDKRGGKNYPALHSDAALEKFEMVDWQRDVTDQISYLAGRPDVDRRAIVLAGHSEGGALVAQAAADDDRVAGLVMLAAIIGPADGSIQLRNYGDLRLRQADVASWASLHVAIWNYDRCIQKMKTDYDPNEGCISKSSPQRLVKDLLDYTSKTEAALTRVKAPILAVQGSVDRNIDPGTLPHLRELLPDADLELHYVPGVNHPLVDVLSDAEPAHVAPRVAELLGAFLASIPRR